MLLQQLLDFLGLVGFVVVNEQDHLALWMSGQLVSAEDDGQQAPEANVVAPPMNERHRPPGAGLNRAPVPAFDRSLARGQDEPLLALARPAAGDGGAGTDFGRVGEQENEVWPDFAHPVSDLFFSPPPAQALACA